MLATTLRLVTVLVTVGDGFGRFCHQHHLSFSFSVGHQHPRDVTNIEILSPTPENDHQHNATNTHVAQDSSLVIEPISLRAIYCSSPFESLVTFMLVTFMLVTS